MSTARLFFVIEPIRSLFSGVVFAVANAVADAVAVAVAVADAVDVADAVALA